MTQPTVAMVRRSPHWLTHVADYVQLIRPRISLMILVVVGVCGYLASHGEPDLWLLAKAMLGTFWVASSASACNQLLERRRDALMSRTANRPLPTGRMGWGQALAFTLASVVVGVAYLAWAVNAWTALWGAATWGLYVGVYTPLKPQTVWNTAIGAVVGALPVFMGWTAVGGSLDVAEDPRGWAIFLVQVLWQFPHFMAIAWLYRQQYERAGMQMLTVVDPTGRRAGRHAWYAALLLLPVSLVPFQGLGGWTTPLLQWGAALLGLAQLWFAIEFAGQRTDRSARRLLRATLLYLPLLLLILVLATLWGR